MAGYSVKLNEIQELAIFSYYSSPDSILNQELFNFIVSKFKFFILLGDLNAKNKVCHCPISRKKGEDLVKIINKYKLKILNNKPTFKRSLNLIDLSIFSESLYMFFKKFDVLQEDISDHFPDLSNKTKNRTQKNQLGFF